MEVHFASAGVHAHPQTNDNSFILGLVVEGFECNQSTSFDYSFWSLQPLPWLHLQTRLTNHK